jgi:hypothetical protein
MICSRVYDEYNLLLMYGLYRYDIGKILPSNRDAYHGRFLSGMLAGTV